MENPKHPYGENVRCDVGGAWPAKTDALPPEAKERGPVFDAFAYANVTLPVYGASGDPALERAIAQHMRDLFGLFVERQQKYGPGNIAAFGDAGVLVRCSDKLARLRNHYFAGGVGNMPDESVEDAWRDLAVYAVIALACRNGEWPGWKAGKP